MTPEPVDAGVERAVSLLAPKPVLADDPPTAEDVRESADGLAASEEELVLLAMFGADAEELLKMIRGRHSRTAVLVAEDEDAERAERIRELVKIVQESGVGEIEIEDEGMRVSVRRADEPGQVASQGIAPVPVRRRGLSDGTRGGACGRGRRHTDRVADGGLLLPGAEPRSARVRRHR